MAAKEASEVAKRCLCLELLLQRLGLDIDEDDPAAERDAVRQAWLARVGDLGLETILHPEERAFLERPAGSLTEAETDDIEGRVIGALVLLWALKRLEARPSAALLGEATVLIGEHGILGDGSISAANATVAAAELRPESELREALAAYTTTTSKDEADQMVSALSVQMLSWLL